MPLLEGLDTYTVQQQQLVNGLEEGEGEVINQEKKEGGGGQGHFLEAVSTILEGEEEDTSHNNKNSSYKPGIEKSTLLWYFTTLDIILEFEITSSSNLSLVRFAKLL